MTTTTKTELLQSMANQLTENLGLDDQFGTEQLELFLECYFQGELLIRVSKPQLQALHSYIPSKYKAHIDLDNDEHLAEIAQFVGKGLFEDISVGMASLAYNLEQADTVLDAQPIID